MTADHTPPPPRAGTTLVLDLGSGPQGEPRLDVLGPLDAHQLEAALDEVALHQPEAFTRPHRIDHHDDTHHTLRLAPGTAGATFPWSILADLLTRPPGARARARRAVQPTAHQRELLADAESHPGRHIERLTWTWHGHLEPDRFRSAWQAVVDKELATRAAFSNGPQPTLLLHDHVNADVRWLPAGTADWADLIEDDIQRGIDPHLPPALRVTALGGPDHPGTTTPTHILLTYHHALLDDWSAHLLVRDFHRAYLAGGTLPGGERRPDLQDHLSWLHRQDTTPPRDLWSRPTPRTPCVSPVPLSTAEGPATGHSQIRMNTDHTEKLFVWAARWGTTESCVLQAVWAVLLYRASGAQGPARVRFAVTASGRGIPLEGIERLPAALRTTLPLHVEVDPRSTVATLLTEIRDRTLDMTAHEWVSPGQIHAWSPPAATTPLEGSLLAFENTTHPPDTGLTTALHAEGIHVSRPEPLGAHTAYPLTLTARHDEEKRLVLTASHTPTPHTDASQALNHSTHLLTELPYHAADTTTIADLLHHLPTTPTPTPTPTTQTNTPPPTTPTPTPTPTNHPIIPLRTATTPNAGLICLITTPDTPHTRYHHIAANYPGPEEIILLPTTHNQPPHHTPTHLTHHTRPLTLAAFPDSFTTACTTAHHTTTTRNQPPLIVLTSTTTTLTTLTHTLATTATQATTRT
ncbi:putative peptide synthetase [Streptomyces sp. GBA 94-10 4N24]|uniref:condensation domain-containing protein n=1 Tax=Streptomyces sp. GBA 94-10 4N24 TaxID=1218177 RepID=UPI0021FBAA0C|nr:condensation domain-containing protein [Streptomyces sp. GBA 94-10 4N24]UYB73266.1 putative peptide synthetase [Streptomyces sp. GBA 94-10 4N24]UYB73289.1 putative peptide synthetase [Streptomyces sp. GBA 94-10 4N24]UZN57132.1 putative peptide synthetase [Streptomyces sp. GBA 94-10 4N24]UZN62957.1 putative peptide synthetase [Streptomyces sp. GBA 94-10 4N24]